MSVSPSFTYFTCPSCKATLDLVSAGTVQCMNCQWTGDVYSFAPRAMVVEEAVAALPEDATCLHHPRKKAVAVCAGTGDYVCALCAVELNGQTYSAEYLNVAGKDLAVKAFDRTLPRPDGQIVLYLLCCFIPGVNYLVLPLAFIWIPHAVYLYIKLLRLRKENELLRRVVGKAKLVTIPILLGLFSLGWITGVVILTIVLLNKR